MNKHCNDSLISENNREARTDEKESCLKGSRNIDRYRWSCFFASLSCKEYRLYVCIVVMVSALFGWFVAPILDLDGINSFVIDNSVFVFTLIIAFVAALFSASTSKTELENSGQRCVNKAFSNYRWVALIFIAVIVFFLMVLIYDSNIFQFVLNDSSFTNDS